jgi:hypothetical protein
MAAETGDDLGASEYLGYLMLRNLYEVDNRPVSRSQFWKLCCIAARYLIEQDDLDIGFPRYWYKYGELAGTHDISRDFFNAPSARFWAGQEFHPDREIPDHEFDVESPVRDAIQRAVRRTVDRFGKSSVDEIKAYQYRKQAPNEFIEAYSRIRAQFEAVNLNQQQLLVEHTRDGTNAYFEEMLDEMLETFPRRRYGEVLDLYLRWDDTMRLMLDADADFQEVHEFLDFFIEKLSEIVLRFEHNANIPASRLESWEEEKPVSKEELENHIEDVRRTYLLATEQTGELEEVEQEYDDLVSREI